MTGFRHFLATAGMLAAMGGVAALANEPFGDPVADRIARDHVRVQWRGGDPVDVYVSIDPAATVATARQLARLDKAGVYDFKEHLDGRPYFLLRDAKDGTVLRVAERVLPLQRGSNFRDVGGYAAAGGKHVRWGMIYRAAAQPVLTRSDFRYLQALHLKSDVDLRSMDEREYSPDLIPANTGSAYLAVDYKDEPDTPSYADAPFFFKPQLSEIFAALLKDEGPLVVHCTAGQDRTGIVTAIVLAALGVHREEILRDYFLSVKYRRPENEIQRLDFARFPGNAFAAYLSKMSDEEFAAAMTEKPYLYDENGEPYLQESFEKIEKQWGSIDNFLQKELSFGKVDVQKLRSIYLE